jgi:hypothetical protein
MYPRRAKQKLTNVHWDALFDGIKKSGWNLKEVSEVTGIHHRQLQLMADGSQAVPEKYKQVVALLDVYLMATHETNLPTL